MPTPVVTNQVINYGPARVSLSEHGKVPKRCLPFLAEEEVSHPHTTYFPRPVPQ